MAYEQFAEIKLPEFKKFEGVGDFVEGVLVKREHIVMRDPKTKASKEVPVYFLEQNDRSMVKFLAGTDLAEKMMQVPYGSMVKITFKTTEEMKDGKAPMKIFQVMAAKRVQANAPYAELEITDDDIPF